METSTLEAFLAVYESGSFSHAAEKLFLTQPAVSKRVAALEDEVGFRLFERLGRRILLTEAGELLLPRAKYILLEMQESKQLLADLNNEIGGVLHIATSHHLGLHRLPDILRNFAQAYPKVELNLLFTDSEKGCAQVSCGDIEMALITLPQSPPPGLSLETIWEDTLLFMVSKKHVLARSRPFPEITDIGNYPAILPEGNTVTRKLIERPFKELDIQIQVKLETNYLETIRMLVSVGMGWSFLPETMKGDDLYTTEIPPYLCMRNLGIVTRSGRILSRAAEAFCTLLREQQS